MEFDLVGLINLAVLITGIASIVLKGLELGARFTKTKKDDILVGKARMVVTIIGKILHYIALSPKDRKVLMDKDLIKDED